MRPLGLTNGCTAIKSRSHLAGHRRLRLGRWKPGQVPDPRFVAERRQVDIPRAVALFRDPAHSHEEERLKAIGRTGAGRSVLIVFTLRERAGQMFISTISARHMHAKEIAGYEEEAAKLRQR